MQENLYLKMIIFISFEDIVIFYYKFEFYRQIVYILSKSLSFVFCIAPWISQDRPCGHREQKTDWERIPNAAPNGRASCSIFHIIESLVEFLIDNTCLIQSRSSRWCLALQVAWFGCVFHKQCGSRLIYLWFIHRSQTEPDVTKNRFSLRPIWLIF